MKNNEKDNTEFKNYYGNRAARRLVIFHSRL